MEAVAAQQPGITVQVKFKGDLTAFVQQRNVTVTLPAGATVGSLLETLSRTHGEDFSRRLFNGRAKLHHTMLIFVNGEDINECGGLAARLDGGEVELFMLPVICGG